MWPRKALCADFHSGSPLGLTQQAEEKTVFANRFKSDGAHRRMRDQ
jgi:hypothetical protein